MSQARDPDWTSLAQTLSETHKHQHRHHHQCYNTYSTRGDVYVGVYVLFFENIAF